MIYSWNLLRRRVFVQETCPPELEEIGKKMAKNCGGLPLAVHVIGGVLSQGKRTQESWAQIAKDVSSTVANKDEQFPKILSLSYNHLPSHLKPCFLYMGAFPEDYEIRGSKLIKLWVAEGFLKPMPDKSLEEAADVYLKALVDRNLISVQRKETNRIAKSYNIHDLLRDLCVRKASQENFLYVDDWQSSNLPEDDTVCLRRVSVHSSYIRFRDVNNPTTLMRRARSFLLTGPASTRISWPETFEVRLLKVLDILGVVLKTFPKAMIQLVSLSYLACEFESRLPSLISSLRNLQTIIFDTRYKVSSRAIRRIFEMPRIRHIKFNKGFTFHKIPNGKCCVLQENLQSLSTVRIGSDFVELLKSFPNLKKLGVFSWHPHSSDIDLSCLLKLETLKCSSSWSPSSSFFIFPPSIAKVSLHECRIQPQHLNKIGDLPNLQVLKLRFCAFASRKWEPSEGEFNQLQFLLLEMSNLVSFVADETNFPRLERLVIRDCSKLEGIPIGIGDISTLETIEVHKCSTSAEASARKIHEEQLELGNYGLQVRITR